MEHRFSAADRADRQLRPSDAARARPIDHTCQNKIRTKARLVDDRPLGFRFGRPIGTAHCGHRLHFDRHRGRAPALGYSALAISPHLGPCIPASATDPAQVRIAAATFRGRRNRRADAIYGPRGVVLQPHRASRGILCHCYCLPRRTRAHEAHAAASHDVLCRAFVRWDGWRTIFRFDRATCVFLAGGISNLGGARGPLPAIWTKHQSQGRGAGPVNLAGGRTLVLAGGYRYCNFARHPEFRWLPSRN